MTLSCKVRKDARRPSDRSDRYRPQSARVEGTRADQSRQRCSTSAHWGSRGLVGAPYQACCRWSTESRRSGYPNLVLQLAVRRLGEILMFRPPAAGIAEPGASVDMRVQRQFQAERQMVRKTTRGRTAVEGTRRTTGIEQPAVDHREAVARRRSSVPPHRTTPARATGGTRQAPRTVDSARAQFIGACRRLRPGVPNSSHCSALDGQPVRLLRVHRPQIRRLVHPRRLRRRLRAAPGGAGTDRGQPDMGN